MTPNFLIGFVVGALLTSEIFCESNKIPFEHKLHEACESRGSKLVSYDSITIQCTKDITLSRGVVVD